MRQPAVAAAADDLGADPDVDVRGRLELTDEVVRHARLERRRAHDEREAPRVPREMERRLPGRVRAAEDVDLLAGQPVRVRAGAAVEDAGAGRASSAGMPSRRYVDAVARTTARAVTVAPSESVATSRSRPSEGGHLLHEDEPRAEDPGLLVGLACEQRAADAAREPEVVADQRARPRLPPDPGVSTTSVRKPSDAPYTAAERPAGPAPTMSRSTSRVLGLDRRAGGPRELDVARVHELRAVREDHHRQLRVGGESPRSSRPSSESARQNACGNAHCSSTVRSCAARPDHESPTTWIA